MEESVRVSDIDQRLEAIALRRAELDSLLEDPNHAETRHHYRSRYFARALAGEHPFTTPLDPFDETYQDQRKEREGYFSSQVSERVNDWLNDARAHDYSVKRTRWDHQRSERVGIIGDRSTFRSLKDALTLVPISPEHSSLGIPDLDVLLITDAHSGLTGEWAGLHRLGSPLYRILVEEIVPQAQSAGIPIIFYATNDAGSYRRFMSVARLADAVFTSSRQGVKQYQKNVRDGVPVEVLTLGNNPLLSHPLGSFRYRELDFLALGTWDSVLQPQRYKAAQTILDGLANADASLTIIDPLHGMHPSWNRAQSLLPERFLPHYLSERLTADQLTALSRHVPAAVVLDTENNDRARFSQNYLTLQASGTFILSNYNVAVNSEFPHVFMPQSEYDVQKTLEDLTMQDVAERQIAGVRSVFSDHTAHETAAWLLDSVGLTNHATQTPRPVLVAGGDYAEFERFKASQILPRGVELQFVGDDVSQPNLSERTALGAPLIQLHHPENALSYDPQHVRDVVTAFRYSDADVVVGKPLGSDGLYDITTTVAPVSVDHHQVLARWVEPDTGASNSRSEKVYVLTIPAETVADRRRETIDVQSPKTPRLSIIVPVYNNGAHLRFKCFASLKRSSIFEETEILLVDDGSSDPETIQTLEDLSAEYEHVRVYRFPPGGSGSASRPRNKGHELVRAPYFTTLDPDDEQADDGYAPLLAEAEMHPEYDLVLGNALIMDSFRRVENHYRLMRPHVATDGTLVDNILAEIGFAPVRIQSIVAKTDWVRSLGISQVVGSQGQDTFFFQQMIHSARRVGLIPQVVHTYYAAVQTSVVNTIGVGFYRKYVELERRRSQWLAEVGLLDHYKARRLEPFFRNWFLGKFPWVAVDDRKDAMRFLYQIGTFYGKTKPEDWTDPKIQAFYSSELAELRASDENTGNDAGLQR